ncbi:Uncharacterised protein [Amycolatopsis camponoti]|uniref:NERD domain-containing protein n=1 Tax=Amycolatopsis camponoti TaxID=2606593 RepID=A0A6I8LPJ1_9PSEU|nr:hypothetical protein [Amycolatopsis camponoti]VVJ18932.1 Uncharacterised protein [Amycolatopsis camponoti]
MLVAFQRTGEEWRLPAAATHLVGLLRSWGPGPDHLTGLALTGITVPSRLGPRFVDALVFTRTGVVVIAAHSPGAESAWDPGERAGAGVEAAKGALAAHDGGQYVTGLVAVVPSVEETRDRLAEPAGDDPAERSSRPGAITVPEQRLPGGDADWRGAQPGDLDAGRPGNGTRPEAAGASGGEPEQAWREARPGELDPSRAWDKPNPSESDPGQARRQSSPGEPGQGQAGWEPNTSEPGQGQAEWAPSPGEPGAGRAWHEPNTSEPDRRQAGHEPISGPPAPPWLGTDSVPGVAVVLADPRGLRRIIGQHNRWRTVWSADDVLDACYALSLAHLAPPRAALLADGFPARVVARERVPQLPAVLPLPLPLPPEPAPAVVEDEPGPRIPAPRGHSVFPRQRPIRQVPWGLVFVLTLLVTVGVIAAVFVAQVFHGS